MRAVRFLALAALLVIGAAGPASAQDRITAPGSYDAKVGVVPAALPPGSLPPDIAGLEFAPELYVGTLTIQQTGSGVYHVTFVGETADGERLRARASFSSDWTGVLLGNLVVGSSLQSGVIVGIDVAHMLGARINGEGTIGEETRRVHASLGAGGTVESFRIVGRGKSGN